MKEYANSLEFCSVNDYNCAHYVLHIVPHWRGNEGQDPTVTLFSCEHLLELHNVIHRDSD